VFALLQGFREASGGEKTGKGKNLPKSGYKVPPGCGIIKEAIRKKRNLSVPQ